MVALEVLLPLLIKQRADAAAITVWWVLILIYGSLRFDDGIHVAPSSLQLSDEALLGVIWQTKVEKKKKGNQVRSASMLHLRGRLAPDGMGSF